MIPVPFSLAAGLTLTAALALPASVPRDASGPPRTSGWRWPLPPVPRVVRPFSPPAAPWGPGHRGVDLAARPGEAVRAAGSGRVAFAGRVAGRGVVVIDHGGLRTTYLPVEPSVRAGRLVAAGETIGTVRAERGAPGHCPAAVTCLHWGARRGPVYLDPLTLLGGRAIRLLPVWSEGRPPRGTGDGPAVVHRSRTPWREYG